jgi:hypothetical protein
MGLDFWVVLSSISLASRFDVSPVMRLGDGALRLSHTQVLHDVCQVMSTELTNPTSGIQSNRLKPTLDFTQHNERIVPITRRIESDRLNSASKQNRRTTTIIRTPLQLLNLGNNPRAFSLNSLTSTSPLPSNCPVKYSILPSGAFGKSLPNKTLPLPSSPKSATNPLKAIGLLESAVS